MDIRPVNPIGASAPVATATQAADDQSVRPLVTAVREINKSELLGQGREVTFRRDPETKLPVITIVDKATGDVIDQLPPESILEMAARLK